MLRVLSLLRMLVVIVVVVVVVVRGGQGKSGWVGVWRQREGVQRGAVMGGGGGGGGRALWEVPLAAFGDLGQLAVDALRLLRGGNGGQGGR